MSDTYAIKVDFFVIPDPAGNTYRLELVYHGMVVYAPDGRWERIFKAVPVDAKKDLSTARSYLLGCSKGVVEDQSVRHYLLLLSTDPAARNQLFMDGKAVHPEHDLKWHLLKDEVLADGTLDQLDAVDVRKRYIRTMYADRIYPADARAGFVEDVYAQWEWRKAEARVRTSKK
jgi:hypothetical protein